MAGNPDATKKEYDVSNYIAQINAKLPKNATLADMQKVFEDELARSEKRRRDTLASYTKSQQELKALQVERDFFASKVTARLNLTTQQKDELDKLKFEDPDAWKAKLDSLEKDAKNEFDRQNKAEIERLKSLSIKEFEQEKRQQILDDFIKANPDFDITKKELLDRIPPLYVKQLENEIIDFSEFLELSKKFVTAPKHSVKKDEVKTGSSVNISQLAGTSDATKQDAIKNIFEMQDTFKF